jgi:gas vesicle protein
MTHTGSGFAKGIAVGVVAGAALGLVAAPRGRDAKRSAGRFLRAAGEVVENISGLWS